MLGSCLLCDTLPGSHAGSHQFQRKVKSPEVTYGNSDSIQARGNRAHNPPPLNLEGVQSVLYMTVACILETADYEEDATATSAQVARMLATVVATLKDQSRRANRPARR